MKTTAKRPYLRRDFRVFFTVIFSVVVVFVLFFRDFRIPMEIRDEIIASVPPVSVLPPQLVVSASHDQSAGPPGIIQLRDPALLSMPGPLTYRGDRERKGVTLRAFSVVGEGLKYRPYAELKTTEELLMVPDNAALLAGDYLQYRTGNETARERSTPALRQADAKVQVEIGGALKNRGFLKEPVFRTPNSTAPLTPSVLKIGVLPVGKILFALLEKSSGSPEADSLALIRINNSALTAVPEGEGGEVVWGTVSVHWTYPEGKSADGATN
ncbi:MAG: hypothetical protein SFY92_08305 [Verrucomicrobiae bacterium]|nr:hypothetical protein [Verrucomicrobiae bacterium]